MVLRHQYAVVYSSTCGTNVSIKHIYAHWILYIVKRILLIPCQSKCLLHKKVDGEMPKMDIFMLCVWVSFIIESIIICYLASLVARVDRIVCYYYCSIEIYFTKSNNLVQRHHTCNTILAALDGVIQLGNDHFILSI